MQQLSRSTDLNFTDLGILASVRRLWKVKVYFVQNFTIETLPVELSAFDPAKEGDYIPVHIFVH